MSWNGTVRCSYCFQQGHNKRGCPELADRMQKRLDENPNDWRAQQYFEKKKGAKVRRCTYCNRKGHNRATCEELKRDVAEWKQKNASYRRKLAETMIEAGLGVGALIKHADPGWRMEHKGRVVMVRGINPETTYHQPYGSLVICGIKDPRQKNHVNLSNELYEKAYEDIGERYWYGTDLTVLSPTKNCLLRGIPNHEEWLKGGDDKWIKKEIFADQYSPDFHSNKYED